MGSQQLFEIANALNTSLNLLQPCSIQMKDAVAVSKAFELIASCITVLTKPQSQEIVAPGEKKEEAK